MEFTFLFFYFFHLSLFILIKKKILQGLQALQQFLKINKIIQYKMTLMELLLETLLIII